MRKEIIMIILFTFLFGMNVAGFLPDIASAATRVITKHHNFKSFDGNNIYVKEKFASGNKRFAGVVLLFPPFFSSHNYYDCPLSDYSLMDFLARKGFRVFAHDPRGLGLSYHPSDGRSANFEVGLKDAEALVSFVLEKTGARTVSMVASGFGAEIACSHAISHPEQVNALALVGFVWKLNPFPSELKEKFLSQPEGYLQLSLVADFFDKQLLFVSPEVTTWLRETFTVAPVGPMLSSLDLPLIKTPEKLRARLMIFRGTQVGLYSESDNFDFLSKISSRIRTMIVIEGAGIAPTIEKAHYQMVFKDIAWFLAE
jgi:pimeloyl-ACP methyl ester carboxylesterase